MWKKKKIIKPLIILFNVTSCCKSSKILGSSWGVVAISKAPYEHKSAWKQVQGTQSYLSFGIKSLPLKCNLETSTFCQGNQTIFKEHIWMTTFINWSCSAILRNN